MSPPIKNIKDLIHGYSVSIHPHDPCVEYLIAKRVETAFFDSAKLMPKFVLAVTVEGFLVKIIAFIWAYTLNNKLYNL
jgi:hypothetical protein